MPKESRPFDGVAVSYLRHTNTNPGEWIGKLGDGRFLYAVVGRTGILYQAADTVYDACLAVKDDVSCIFEVKGMGVKENRAVPSDAMCALLGIDKNVIIEIGDA